MSDFFSGLVDRAVGRAPSIERRIPPRFEPPRGQSAASASEDPMIQPALQEIFDETGHTPGPPPRARQTVAPPDNSRPVEPKPLTPPLKEKSAPVREPRAESKSSAPATHAITRVERVVEPVAAPAPRAVDTRPASLERARERKSATPEIVRAAPAPKPQPRAESQDRNRVSPAASRPVPPAAIRPKVTPRAPQVIVQRERSAAPTIQVTIGRIEVRAATGAAAAHAAPRPAGPKLNLEDYLNHRAGGSR